MKVLLCGHDHYGYLQSIARGLEANGCRVACLAHERIGAQKAMAGGWLKKARAKARLSRINRRLIQIAAEQDPDLLLAVNGEAILGSTVAKLSRTCATALWLADALANLGIEAGAVSAYRQVFVFEPTDQDHISGAAYLPYGYDPETYRPLNTGHEIDVSFVGAGHENRLPLLNEVARFCQARGYSFAVFGPFRAFRKPGLRMKYRRMFPDLYQALRKNGPIVPAEVNRIFNLSRVVLNIHHPQSREGLNPRTFEIIGAGGLQLVDHKPRVSDFFTPGEELMTFADKDELLTRIESCLTSPETAGKIRKNARRVALEHTFARRLRTLVSQATA